jgi:hypothetical protein
MSRTALLARGQAAAEAGMADTCTVRRRTGEATDLDTAVVTPTYLSPNPYAGKCRVQQRGGVQQRDVGEDMQVLLQLEVQLPTTLTGLQVGDEVTITASAGDTDLVGRTFLIRELAHKSEATARRVQVTERTS